jgi:hypothetical protein
MGEGSQRITARADSENNCLSSCKAHDVSSSPQDDRSFSKNEVGEIEGAAEEGCIASGARREPTRGFQP